MLIFIFVVLGSGGAIFTQYGFVKDQHVCLENTVITDTRLQTFKKDIDRAADYYDMVRMHQYPVNGLMAITEPRKKMEVVYASPSQMNRGEIC